MAVIDLGSRIANSWDDYNNNLKSSDSLIFIDPNNFSIEDGPSSLDLTVGRRFFSDNRRQQFTLTDEGTFIEPFRSLLIETEQRVCLPLNIFGIVIGKGHQIFQGAFISSGKINPGFNGKLNIGLYNGSNKKIHIKRGQPLCSCVFLQMESNMNSPLKNYDASRQIENVFMTKWQKFIFWLKSNKDVIVVFISLFALIASLLNVFANRNFIGY